MFWDKAASLYDLFEMVYNGKVYKGLAMKVADYIKSTDDVLECACGTGMISRHIAPKCHSLIATDVSEGMMKQAKKHCGKYQNVTIQSADIMALTRLLLRLKSQLSSILQWVKLLHLK